MKKNTLLIILSIIEILFLIIFILTFKITLNKSFELSLNGIMSKWISTEDIIISKKDLFLMKLNNISTYIFIITYIIRFIFVNKKKKIFMLIVPLIIFISFIFLYWGNNIMSILGYICLLISFLFYIYTHIINLKDKTKVFK